MVGGLRSGEGNAKEGGKGAASYSPASSALLHYSQEQAQQIKSFAPLRACLDCHTVTSHIFSKKRRFSKPVSACSFWRRKLRASEEDSYLLVKKFLH